MPRTVPADTARSRLDRAFLHGLAWNAAGRWLSQVFRWIATVLTAWFLTPADFGIVGITMLIVGLLQYLAEFGFGAAIVQDRSLESSIVRQIGGAAVLIALGLGLVMILTAPIAAWFYDQPVLSLMLPIMSIRLLIDAFAVVPRSVMVRDLEFRKLSVLEAVESIIMAATTVLAAWLMRSPWAFILGNLVSGLVFVVAVTIVAGTGPAIPRAFSAIRSQVAFGSHVAVSRIAWYAYTNADFAIVGRVMDATVLGLYTFAWSIASLPAEKLAGMVIGVAPSIMSAARSATADVRRYYLLLVRGVALITFPVAVGLALVSRDLVLVVFGMQWAGAVLPLQLLALFFCVRSLATLAPVVMISSGNPRVDRNNSLAFLLILPPLFLLASRWGISAVAATWLVAYPILFAMLGQRWVMRHLNIAIREFLAELWPALVSVGLMAAVVTLLSKLAFAELPAGLRLVFLSLAGALVYVVTIRTLFRRVFDAVLDLIRNRTSPANSSQPAQESP
jgi:O-antigen/teichoic acid export membrane protein